MQTGRRHFLELGLKTLSGALTMATLPLSGQAFAEEASARSAARSGRFQVGEFLKFKSYRDSAGLIHSSRDYLPDDWFEALGLSPVDVIYSSRFLAGTGVGATLDADRLQQLARAVPSNRLVALDAEEWDASRSHPDSPLANGKSIVQNLVDVVQTFKRANPAALVGLYSEVPQNTYGFTATTPAVYDELNPHYAPVAAQVDYYSPSLYNYRFDGTPAGDAQWARSAAYAVHACRLLDGLNRTRKPVLPYVTPAWKDTGNVARYLTEDQMRFRLQTLRQLGASGCILWLSSSAKEPGGDAPLVLDPTTGWLRAAVEFAKEP
jgi:hypothetical protein